MRNRSRLRYCGAIVAACALVASACGAGDESTAAVAPSSAAPAVLSTVPEVPASPTTSAEPLVPVLSGRDAIAAATGEPHILWFWGVH